MSVTKNLLVELFVEELPPKALKKLGEVFSQTLLQSLKSQGLAGDDAVVTPYASPRRLAAHVTAVAAQAADRQVAQKLMPVAVGLDAAGNATPALAKKLAALGADASVVPQLRRENDGKADVLFFDSVAKGATLADGLQKALEAALAALPIPKVMTYQLADGWTTVNFVRPAHGLVALHGVDVVPLSILGLKAGRDTHGHRFEASVDPVAIADADSYAATLEKDGAVVANYEERSRNMIQQLLSKARELGCWLEIEPAFGANSRAGLELKETEEILLDDPLVQEVTALVERPNVLIGRFEEAFLEVPQECLILTMKANQKYFPLLDAQGKLTNKFLIVSNIRPSDPSDVIGGNERVVRPRLADAKFFFDQDRKKKLEDRVAGLDKVVYHNKLGTQGQRMQRVCRIAEAIGNLLGNSVLADKASAAARLAKADLLTDMVGEFPELQGIMGRYYALHDGLGTEIADAIEDHYKPRFAGDSLPRGLVGTVVALADKLETLVGLFAIGQIPTGDKDPFALRRHALGVVRLLIESDQHLTLDKLLLTTANAFSDLTLDAKAAPLATLTELQHGEIKDSNVTLSALSNFIYDRLSGSLRDQGYSAQEVDAVVSQRPQRLGDIPKRLAAVRAFAALPEAAALAAANKRVGNILKKVEEPVAAAIDESLLREDAEKALAAALEQVAYAADAAFESGDYTASLQALAALRGPVDTFFNDVMVNAEDEKLRNNRLGLLATLHGAMNRVADLSKLST